MRAHRDVRTCGTLGRLQTLHVIRHHPFIWCHVVESDSVCVLQGGSGDGRKGSAKEAGSEAVGES